ncbi:MAG: hypothetical protein SFW67_28685 [Myxococcaceae bacterium]|nr:hypothetical protein [Myxococcaceae bacterium]
MKKLLIVAMLFTFTGCFHGRVVSGARGGPVESELGFSLLWGLTSTKTTAVECRNGLSSAGSYLPWWAFLLSGITVGIVTPVMKEYSCNIDAPAPQAAMPMAPPAN